MEHMIEEPTIDAAADTPERGMPVDVPHPALLRVQVILADMERDPEFGEQYRHELIGLVLSDAPESAKRLAVRAFRIIDLIQARRAEAVRAAL